MRRVFEALSQIIVTKITILVNTSSNIVDTFHNDRDTPVAQH